MLPDKISLLRKEDQGKDKSPWVSGCTAGKGWHWCHRVGEGHELQEGGTVAEGSSVPLSLEDSSLGVTDSNRNQWVNRLGVSHLGNQTGQVVHVREERAGGAGVLPETIPQMPSYPGSVLTSSFSLSPFNVP